MDTHRAIRASREFALRDQMLRAAISIPSNIAEGSERGGKDFVRFLRIARGSAAEFRTQCYIASGTGLLPKDKADCFIAESKKIARMLTGLARSAGER